VADVLADEDVEVSVVDADVDEDEDEALELFPNIPAVVELRTLEMLAATEDTFDPASVTAATADAVEDPALAKGFAVVVTAFTAAPFTDVAVTVSEV